MLTAKRGDVCYLDSTFCGLVRGRAVAVGSDTVTIKFDVSEQTDSWHGQGGNPYSGRTEQWAHRDIVPARAVIKPTKGRFHARIAAYTWTPDAA
jgi:hypothetical protein